MADKDEKGNWIDSIGSVVPAKYVKIVDKKRDRSVERIHAASLKVEKALKEFRALADREISAYLDFAFAESGVQLNAGGNYTLTNFSATRRVEIKMGRTLELDERAQGSKQLIDECLESWSEGGNEKLRAVVFDAFRVDKKGKVDTARLFRLFRLKIKDEKWERAMKLLHDSIMVTSQKPYMTVRYREKGGTWIPVVLDIAQINSSVQP